MKKGKAHDHYIRIHPLYSLSTKFLIVYFHQKATAQTALFRIRSVNHICPTWRFCPARLVLETAVYRT